MWRILLLVAVLLVTAGCVGRASGQVVPDEDVRLDDPLQMDPPSIESSLQEGAELERGLHLYRNEKYAEATSVLGRVVTSRQTPVEVHAMYVHALLRSDRPDAAVLAAESALDRFSGHPGLLILSGSAHAQRGALVAALEAYKAAEASVERGEPWPGGFGEAAFQGEVQQIHLALGKRAVQRGAYDEALVHARQAAERGPHAAPAHALRAYAHLQQGAPDRSAAITEEALRHAPENLPLLRVRAQALSELGRHEDLVPVFEQLYRTAPDDADIGLGYAQALLLDGQNQAAQLLFQKLLQTFPKERRIYDAIVELNRRRLNFEGAARIRKQQQTVFPGDESLAWDRAELLEQAKQFAQARAVYDSLASVHPNDPEPALAAAATYEYTDSLGRAAEAYRTVTASFPDRVEPLQALATVVMQQAQEDGTHWPDVLDVHRKLAGEAYGRRRAEALSGVGKAHEALGHPDAARSAYRAALDADDETTWAHYRLAALGDAPSGPSSRTESLSHAEQALRLVLRQAEDTQSQMMGTLRETGLPRPGDRNVYLRAQAASDLAAEIFTFFGDRFPLEQTEPVILDVLDTYDASGRLLYLTGRYYEAHSRDADALRYFEQATREAPDLRDAHLALGRHHAEAGRTRPAILSYERALGADERHPDAYRALIGLYREQGRLDVLVRRWQSRLRATPTNDVLREHLADALHRAGRHDDARAIAAGDAG